MIDDNNKKYLKKSRIVSLTDPYEPAVRISNKEKAVITKNKILLKKLSS